MPTGLRDVAFSDTTWEQLVASAQLRVIPGPSNDRAGFGRTIADADVVVTSWGCPPIDEEVLALAPRLSLLVNYGATVKPFVTPASWARGVRVTQAGAGMVQAVAEVALCFTLSLLHRVGRFDHALHSGLAWEIAQRAPQRRELAGSRVGVIGASRVGRRYIAMLQTLGADVALFDPYVDESEATRLSVTRLALDELLRTSPLIAVHAPALAETRHMLGREQLRLMPDGALLVNTARSSLIDEDALLDELRSGRLDAAIDVFDEEPLPRQHPFRSLPNVLLTPHTAGGTLDARRRQGEIVVDEIARYLSGGPLRHEVTEDDLVRMG
jgi:phosphoglycerate dehydrogenase-like enzyme